jgi:hypothetical protein
VAVIVSRLQAALTYCNVPLDIADINTRLVYSEPSTLKTTDHILNLSTRNNGTPTINEVGATARRDKMERLVERYLTDIISETSTSEQSASGIHPSPEGWNIILTGTTGLLGSHLLATLETMPPSKIKKVFCLNRSTGARTRQEKSSTARGLKPTWDDQRVIPAGRLITPRSRVGVRNTQSSSATPL